MKKNFFLTAFAIIAIVASALAVKANFFGQGSVYCASTCAANTRVNFRCNPNGTMANPCGTTGGVENASYSWSCDMCTQNNKGCRYDAVSAGK